MCTLASVDPAGLVPASWATEFKPFTLFHLVSVLAFAGLIAVWCIVGRVLLKRSRESERTFRKCVGYAILAYQLWFLSRFFYPGPFTWERSFPLMLCDLAALVSGAALIWHTRPLRTVLYFWAIGLSTQGYFSPIIHDGYETLRYWTFWIGHTAIIGGAIYDLVVHRYRPAKRDLFFAIGISIVYTIVVIGVNLALDRSGLLPAGVRANYGYLGNTKPDNPTLIDKLGPWPQRIFIIVGIVIAVFTVLWAIWQIPFLSPTRGRNDHSKPRADR
jgi:hypothetical integral membrane protein (TIGR02206 family)